MKLKHLLYLLIPFLFSCSKSEFEIESKHENGNTHIVSKTLGDTIINEFNFGKSYKVKFDENGDTLRKGVYLNSNAIGQHVFYEKNQIDCFRTFIIPDSYFIDLDKRSESIDLLKYMSKSDTTYLNSIVYINSKGDTLFDKSLFCRNHGFIEKSDSLKLSVEFYFQNLTIDGVEFYTMPKDTSMLTISGARGNSHKLHIDKTENLENFTSMAILYAYETKQQLDSNIFSTRAIFINEKVKTSHNKK